MLLRTIKKLKNIKGQRVLVRCDLDVPLKKNKKSLVVVADDRRLKNNLATINYLIKQGAQPVLIGHLGRPAGKLIKNLSLQPVAKRLEKLLGRKINLINIERFIGQAVFKAVKDNQLGGIIMLENLRFSDREEINCKRFAKQLAKLADIYVNEAFAVSHRSHASVEAIQYYLPSYAGLNLSLEVTNLASLLKYPRQPLVLIIGGSKVATKLPVIEKFISLADYFLLGGAVANTFIKAMALPVGKSLFDNQFIPLAQKIIDNLFQNGKLDKLFLPFDVKVSSAVKRVDNLNSKDTILDIGPISINLYLNIIKQAKTVIWNGPMGKFEDKNFKIGTYKIAKALLNSKAKIVIGGGDTDKIFNRQGVKNNIFISSGGGAMLAFLAGKTMPGLIRLKL